MFNISNSILGYSSQIVVPVGIVLNLLTVIILWKIRYHKTPIGLHLLCLAMSEFLLLVGFGISWHWPFKITYSHFALCIIENFIVASQQIWSTFLMVSITTERYLAIAFPLKVKSWNLKTISNIVISCFGIVSCIIGGLSAARRTLLRNNIHNQCRNNPNSTELNYFFDMITTSILIFGLCPLLTFAFTVLIAYQLYKQKKARITMVQENQSTSQPKEFRITVMLFAIACLFLAAKIFQISIWYMLTFFERNSVYFKQATIGSYYARLLIICFHSTNSLIYFIFFKTFREGFLSIIRCGRKRVTNEGQRNVEGSGQGSFSLSTREGSSWSPLRQTWVSHAPVTPVLNRSEFVHLPCIQG